MSSMPSNMPVPSDASTLPMTLPRLLEKKRMREPIVMVTAYDYPSALAAEAAAVDLVLMGDSGAMTVLGYPSTVAVELEELLVLAKAVRRGLNTPFLRRSHRLCQSNRTPVTQRRASFVSESKRAEFISRLHLQQPEPHQLPPNGRPLRPAVLRADAIG